MKKTVSIFLDYQESKIHFLRFGEGKEVLFAFHGYGYDGQIFLPLVEALGERYTIYAVDLPFHGQTLWNPTSYGWQDVMTWIEMISAKEKTKKIALLGYSLGGRIVQKIFPHLLHKISQVYLLAPDGMYTRGLVNAHLVPRGLRVLISKTMKEPGWFIAIAKWFNRMGLLSNYNLRFMSHHLKGESRRRRLFHTWIAMSDFRLYPRKTKLVFRDSAIPIKLFFGKKDEAIPLASGQWMAAGLTNVELFVLDKGHRLIDFQLVQLMRENEKKAH